jgi:heat shock protein HslJ
MLFSGVRQCSRQAPLAVLDLAAVRWLLLSIVGIAVNFDSVGEFKNQAHFEPEFAVFRAWKPNSPTLPTLLSVGASIILAEDTVVVTQKADGLYHHSWKLAEIGLLGALRPIPPQFTLTLQCEEELHMHGKSACNRSFATYHVDRPRLRFQAVGATRMMCREPAMAWEEDYFAALTHVETYRLQADRLTLFAFQGKSILVFRSVVAS